MNGIMRDAPAAPKIVARTGAADWLPLAAAPTFALMALLTGGLGGGPVSMLCSGPHGASVLTGMVPMYGLMSVFHAAPLLRLIRASAVRPPRSARRRADSWRTTG